MSKPLLFSIDVEDLLERFPNGKSPVFDSHVPQCMERFLDLFDEFNVKITCFICGDLARKFPEVVKKIEVAGHEIACHTDLHIPLNQLGRKEFKSDLEENIASLRNAGVKGEILGFRAPIFSLTDQTSWAYEILSELGFKYSSSILPARNPQYGWEDFGPSPKKILDIIELPISISNFGGLKVPIGGIYFRWLPYWFIRKCILDRIKEDAFLTFIHPYDIDENQEYFNHPDINNFIYSSLLYFRRSNVIPRLRGILKFNLPTMTYLDYVRTLPI